MGSEEKSISPQALVFMKNVNVSDVSLPDQHNNASFFTHVKTDG